jgi:hypothetical protein
MAEQMQDKSQESKRGGEISLEIDGKNFSAIKNEQKVPMALQMIEKYGGIDGEHHKQWVLDQIARILCGTKAAYEEWVEDMKNWNEQDEEYEYDWSEGTPP